MRLNYMSNQKQNGNAFLEVEDKEECRYFI